jgi:hypothetical protein
VAALLLVVPATASAQETVPLKQQLSLTGQSQKGKQLRATYTIDRFARARSGRLVSVGTLRGRLGNRRVAKRNVSLPAAVARGAGASQVLPPLPNACQILNLRLGPINLDLLGLVVRTNLINVRIDGQRGPGNLLGNLLCGITAIFDPQGLTTGQNAAVLNSLLALVPRR